MKYCAILRGINVSGKNIIKMDALRLKLENIGFQSVRTYIQSGNVCFESDIENNFEIASITSICIQDSFNLKVPVLVLRDDELEVIIERNPFLKLENFDAKFMHITFLEQVIDQSLIPAIEEKRGENELIYFANQVVYLYLKDGYGITKLSNTFIEKKLKNTATTRNWNTCQELSKMLKI